MAIYHYHISIVKRSSGRSSVAAAAYIASAKLHNHRDGQIYDFSRKSGVAHSQIILPEGAPKEYANREKLWNAVERVEKRLDAQTARTIELALPRGLSHDQYLDLIRAYIGEYFTSQGMIADFSLHDKGDGNPHVHIMLTMRSLTPDGFGKKVRDWNDRSNAEIWREGWAKIYNRALEKYGIDERVDHRSYARQGLDIIPTQHLGYKASQLERLGIASERGEYNRRVYALRSDDLEAQKLQETKEQLVRREISRLSRLKNRYLTLSMAVAEKRQTEQSLQRQREKLSNNAREVKNWAEFIDQRAQKRLSLLERLSTANPSEKVIFDRQLASLDQSLLQDQALLSSRFQITPDQITSAANQWSQAAQSLQEQLGGLNLARLEELVNSLLQKFLEAFSKLVALLGSELTLQSLEPLKTNLQLSPQQNQILSRAQLQLENLLAPTLQQTLTRDHGHDFSRSH